MSISRHNQEQHPEAKSRGIIVFVLTLAGLGGLAFALNLILMSLTPVVY